MFKVSVLFLVLSLCVYQSTCIPPEMLAKLPEEVLIIIKDLRSQCLGPNGLTDNDIDTYVITNEDEKYKCYMMCMLKSAGWMTDDKTIKYKYILETAHDSYKGVLDAAFEKCDNIPDGAGACDKAYNFHACLAKADSVHWFLP